MKSHLVTLSLFLASVAVPTSAITIDGDFSDFGAETIVDTASGNLADLRLTSDASFIYINYNFVTTTTPSADGGTFIAIDIDNDPLTGFDIFGQGVLGSEAAYQNDFPFSQSVGTFNDGLGLVGAAMVNSTMFGPVDGVEIAIPIGATLSDATPLFTPGEEVTIGVYNSSSGDFLYGTVTVVPEPSSLALLGIGGLAMARRRRK